MVFIVKLPAKKSAGTSNQDDVDAKSTAPHIQTTSGAEGGILTHVSEQSLEPLPPTNIKADTTNSPVIAEQVLSTSSSNVDVLLAPSVLRHRYVRGVDKSNIVERPERIRAVLLGIAGVHAMSTKLSGTSRLPQDILTTKLSSMTMKDHESPLRVFISSRVLSLDEPEPALSDIHAHASEPASYSTQTDYMPDPETRSIPDIHLARLSLLATKAPHNPPGSLPRSTPSDHLSDATSSDGEGDERMHASEIPDTLPQGDLYLCGPHESEVRDTQDGGSREAIGHALGACVEAVDRVVAAASVADRIGTEIPRESPYLTSQQLFPIQAGLSDIPPSRWTEHTPAKRAFVLSRPPGHHCSGADPSGFCWVNNAMVAAAHAYRAHSIDRVVILDIDLHHGNGTQALAWRRNADAAASDSQRQARLQSMMRSMQRTGSAASRQAARVADATRTRWERLLHEESLVGPRAQRLFYGSLHDIESFPCENGDAELIRNASVCLGGAHGQWIWNGTYENACATG